jgi:hypothetical protein
MNQNLVGSILGRSSIKKVNGRRQGELKKHTNCRGPYNEHPSQV